MPQWVARNVRNAGIRSGPWSEESPALLWELYYSTYLAPSCRWHIPNGRFQERPARDWRRISSCVYAWRAGSWLSRPRNSVSRPTRLDANAFLDELAIEFSRSRHQQTRWNSRRARSLAPLD